MRFREILAEAVYDNVAVALKRAFPHRVSMIDDELTWAKSALERPDRINWYMLIVKNYFNNTLDRVKGTYRFTSLDQLHNDLTHFYGYNVPAIERYVYNQQSIGDVLSALDRELKKYQEAERNRPRPVTPRTGDHVLFDFGSGVQWWFVDRGYCPDEGRSGQHCGNVVGQHKKDQRMLSLRKDGNVLLTFVLEPDGTLGEMKARGNQKPVARYHPYIAKLLMWDRITGITGQGYMPDANFSMFDLSANDLAFFDQNKPRLIVDQCRVTPIEILKAPESIQKKYQQHIKNSAIQQLISDPSTANWSRAVQQDRTLIIYAPPDMPNFEQILLKYFGNGETERDKLLRAPSSISRNPELLNKIMAVNGFMIAGVNPSVQGYQNLCRTAVNQDGHALMYVPEESRDRLMCQIAVKSIGLALRYVPMELRDREICFTAFKSYGRALMYVPEESRDRLMCRIAVNQNGYALEYVPMELRDLDMCRIAVKQNGGALQYVPMELRDQGMCRIAVKLNGDALLYVPYKLRDQDMCRIAVNQDGYALRYVPMELRDRLMCRIAVKSNGDALQYVPDELRDRVQNEIKKINNQ